MNELRLERRRTLTGRMAAFATRNLVRLSAWRARRQATDTVRGRTDQTFRGFIQVNLIRPR